eukprot:6210779-Pleurochrysis_carterae.AAC.1
MMQARAIAVDAKIGTNARLLCPFMSLPQCLQEHIIELSVGNALDLFRVGLVCRAWRELSMSDHIWRRIVLESYPLIDLSKNSTSNRRLYQELVDVHVGPTVSLFRQYSAAEACTRSTETELRDFVFQVDLVYNVEQPLCGSRSRLNEVALLGSWCGSFETAASIGHYIWGATLRRSPSSAALDALSAGIKVSDAAALKLKDLHTSCPTPPLALQVLARHRHSKRVHKLYDDALEDGWRFRNKVFMSDNEFDIDALSTIGMVPCLVGQYDAECWMRDGVKVALSFNRAEDSEGGFGLPMNEHEVASVLELLLSEKIEE